MTENFSEIINEETASQKLLQWSGEYERTCGHKPLALIHSYGCQQNVSDGEKIKGMLSKVGYEFTSDVNESLYCITPALLEKMPRTRCSANLATLNISKKTIPSLL